MTSSGPHPPQGKKKVTSVLQDLKGIDRLFRLSGTNGYVLLFPILLSFLIAGLEGVSTALLVPLVQGLLRKDFTFILAWPWAEAIVGALPRVFRESSPNIFFWLVAVTVLAGVMRVGLSFLSGLVYSWQLKSVASKIQKRIFGRFLGFGKLYFDGMPLGRLIHLTWSYVDSIVNQTGALFQSLTGVLTVLVYLLLLMKLSLPVTAIALLFFPLLNAAGRVLTAKIRITSEFTKEYQRDIFQYLSNMLGCIPLIKINHREKAEQKKLSLLVDKYRAMQFSTQKKSQLLGPVHEMVVLAAAVLLISTIGFLVFWVPGTEAAHLLVFLYIFRRFMAGLAVFNKIGMTLSSISVLLPDILELFSDAKKHRVHSGAKEFSGLTGGIECRGVSFAYDPEVPVLRNVSFTIPKGQMVAIVGATGSGKTTLINLILRLYEVAPGTLFIDGTDIREYYTPSLMDHMALVSQDAYLFNDSIRANLTYGISRDITDADLMDVAKKARLQGIISILPHGFGTIIGDRGVKLSGGEKQRLAIARALLKGAEILILDEATSALDSVTEQLVQESIDEAIRDKTSIVIAHRLSTIRHADKIVLIENGRVAEQGTLEELLEKKGRFHGFWRAQKMA